MALSGFIHMGMPFPLREVPPIVSEMILKDNTFNRMECVAKVE
jgi:hypothetical protein